MARHTRLYAVLRSLRIIVTGVSAMICLLMIVWWVRSYWWMDGGFIKLSPSYHIQFHAGEGRMCIWFEHKPIKQWFEWYSNPITVNTPPGVDNRIPWFDLNFWPTFARLYTAHGLLTVLSASTAVLPWCPRKFSLRGLLIATTAFASIVGLIVWVDRTF